MAFESKQTPPLFLCKEEELDNLIFKERMDRLCKKQNYYLAEINKEDSFKLVRWLSERKLWCEKCNKQFYSNEGFVNHGCMR